MHPHERAALLDVYDAVTRKADAAQRGANEAEAHNDYAVRNQLLPEARLWSALAGAVRRALVHDKSHPQIVAFVDDEYERFAEWCESTGTNHTDF